MIDRAAVVAAWRRHGGNITEAARELGISRHKLTRALGDLHTPRKRYKGRDGQAISHREPVFVAEFWIEAWVHDELRAVAGGSDMTVRELIISILREVANDERNNRGRGG